MKKSAFLSFFLILISLAADQFTKYLIKTTLPPGEEIVIIENILNINHIRNRGAAFGMASNAPEAVRSILLIVAPIIAVLLLMILIAKNIKSGDQQELTAHSLILSGAIGNLIDRIKFDHVTDFIQVFIHKYEYPSFNIADSCITIGVMLLILTSLFRGNKSSKAKKGDCNT